MSPLFTTRRSQWLPGLAVLAGGVGIGSILGLTVGVQGWPVYAGLVVVILLMVVGLERLLTRRAEAPPAASVRAKLKVIPGGKPAVYDLAKDDSTDNQRYLM